jgi:hypothetical protein
MRAYLWNLLVWFFSHGLNAATGGEPEEQLSMRCGRSHCVLCRWLCAVLDRFDRGHCHKAGK